MRYQKRVSYVQVIGKGWYGQGMAYQYDLHDYELAGIRAESEGQPYTREGVEQWLATHSGDFQSIEDFAVTISDGDGRDFDSEFASEESECRWSDAMYPADEADVG